MASAKLRRTTAENLHARKCSPRPQACPPKPGPHLPAHAGVRDDIARLVQHAEQAQIDAEAAVARLRAECEDKVGRLQQELERAAEGRAAAEATAADLGQQLAAATEQLAAAQAMGGAAQVWQVLNRVDTWLGVGT